MSRKHNTKHPERGRSNYSKKRKIETADRYGTYKDGKQISPDHLNTKVEKNDL